MAEGHDEKVCDWQDTQQENAVSIQQANVSSKCRPTVVCFTCLFFVVQFSVNVDVPQHNCADIQDQTTLLDISLGHFESFVTASPEAPVFSPITPQHTCSVLSVADATGLSTPSFTQSPTLVHTGTTQSIAAFATRHTRLLTIQTRARRVQITGSGSLHSWGSVCPTTISWEDRTC